MTVWMNGLVKAAVMAVTIGAGAQAMAGQPGVSASETLVDQAWAQIAAGKPGDCAVDRIAKDWEAKGKPKVKGWAEDVTDAEAEAAYECIKPRMTGRYGKSDEMGAKEYPGWPKYNTVAYPSSTHGGRFVNNYGNDVGAAYGKFEKSGTMPQGAVLVKDSFGINKKGEVKLGPLFTMIKMESGFNAESKDWRYALIFPNGKLMGATGGQNSKKLGFCINCHVAAAETDSMFFMPEEYRGK
ncbi:MAG: cytochrome P460 family protein [Alphaproteobacteria bacterium]|nr:cytochrome P460 family protein [Alphaproteobacteria bacterium]